MCLPPSLDERLLGARAQSILAILTLISVVCISAALAARDLGAVWIVDRRNWELPLGQIDSILLLAL